MSPDRELSVPGRLFHAQLAVPTIVLLWAWSYPGGHALLIVAAGCWILASAIAWAAWGLPHLATSVRTQARSFAVAPIAGLLVVILLVADVPLRARFELSRSDFDAAVATVAEAGRGDDEWHGVDAPESIGTFAIRSAHRTGDSIIFFEETGSFLYSAGFAYLPDGPSRELGTSWFEAPSFRNLGGDWYAFVAAW